MRKIFGLLILIIFCSIFGCDLQELAPKLYIPQNIDEIKVSRDKGTIEYHLLATIKDKNKINKILAFLEKQNNKQWVTPFGGTMPILPYKADFSLNGNFQLGIGFGNEMLSGTSVQDSYSSPVERLISLSIQEEKELSNLMLIEQ